MPGLRLMAEQSFAFKCRKWRIGGQPRLCSDSPLSACSRQYTSGPPESPLFRRRDAPAGYRKRDVRHWQSQIQRVTLLPFAGNVQYPLRISCSTSSPFNMICGCGTSPADVKPAYDVPAGAIRPNRHLLLPRIVPANPQAQRAISTGTSMLFPA